MTDMANSPKKANDPTEVALSAIQEALNVRESEGGQGMAPPVPPARPPVNTPTEPTRPEPRRRPNRTTPPAESDLFLDDSRQRGAMPRAEEEPSGRLAANDDRQTIGQILQTLQPHTGSSSNLIAVGAAVAWVVLCLILTWAYWSDLQAALGVATVPALIGL